MASKFQDKIIAEYKKKGYFVVKLAKTNKNGIPDIICLKAGKDPIFIESKEKNDTLKPLQKFRINELKRKGFKAFCLQDGKGVIF